MRFRFGPLIGKTRDECQRIIWQVIEEEPGERKGLFRFYENNTEFSHTILYVFLSHDIPAESDMVVELRFIDDVCVEEAGFDRWDDCFNEI